MYMPVDSKIVINKAGKVGQRKTYSVSLDEEIMESFKDNCEKNAVKYSQVIEVLIREFMEDSKKKGK